MLRYVRSVGIAKTKKLNLGVQRTSKTIKEGYNEEETKVDHDKV